MQLIMKTQYKQKVCGQKKHLCFGLGCCSICILLVSVSRLVSCLDWVFMSPLYVLKKGMFIGNAGFIDFRAVFDPFPVAENATNF